MKKIFVNGTFDIIHPGHIMLLNYAKSLGDHLTVGIDTDARVRLLKGDERPINNQFIREMVLMNLKAVDAVELFSTDQQLIDLIKDCDIMVKGSDYKEKSIIGKQYAKELIFYDRIPGYSTTETIKNIIAR
jgi:D-beta-D-heptose 7-phosphate kinase/D-beta-D-heptose 1-phosphate adenosyltransferase